MPDIDPFQMLDDGAPVRRRRDLRWTRDEDGNEVLLPMEADSLDVSESVDSEHIYADRFYHCGDPMTIPAGGKCAEGGCSRISCQKCAGRCARCQKPLCLEHSQFIPAEDGPALRLCWGCHGAVRRERMLRALGRVLLSPFVEFGRR
jgi:hypothetical protein